MKNYAIHFLWLSLLLSTINCGGKDVTDIYNKGMQLQGQGKHIEAIDAFQKVLKTDSDKISAYYNIGSSYFALGLLEEVIATYNEVLEIDPEDTYTYFNIGIAYYNLGRYELAIENF